MRLIIADQQHEKKGSNVIFVTAMTHAAIKTCRTMILRLIRAYQSVLPSVKPYLDNVDVQLVSRGNDHPPPRCAWPFIEIYIGTLYQVSRFFVLAVPTLIVGLVTPLFKEAFGGDRLLGPRRSWTSSLEPLCACRSLSELTRAHHCNRRHRTAGADP